MIRFKNIDRRIDQKARSRTFSQSRVSNLQYLVFRSARFVIIFCSFLAKKVVLYGQKLTFLEVQEPKTLPPLFRNNLIDKKEKKQNINRSRSNKKKQHRSKMIMILKSRTRTIYTDGLMMKIKTVLFYF